MSTIPPLTFAQRLRIARENAGLEQGELAHRLGVTRNTIGRYETGTHTPRRGTVTAWAAETGVAVAWLLGDVVTPSEPAQLERRRTSRLTKRVTGGYRFRPLLTCSLAA